MTIPYIGEKIYEFVSNFKDQIYEVSYGKVVKVYYIGTLLL